MGKGISAALLVWVLLVGSSSQSSEIDPAGAEQGATVSYSHGAVIEEWIDEVYRNCIRSVTIGGREIEMAIPFGQNGERFEEQFIYRGGKGEPLQIWNRIERLIESADFSRYRETIESPGPKLIIFDLEKRTWFAIRDSESVKKLWALPYPGTKKTVFHYIRASEFSLRDLYNYLYCIGSVGLDCSGLVYNIQKAIALNLGSDLDWVLAGKLNRDPSEIPGLIGLPLYYSRPDLWERIDDRILNLRPGDIFLFMGREGRFRHSAVIQSIDWVKGEICYIQCTDWALQHQRGVHKSYIYFNPDTPFIRISDQTVEWTQRIEPTFPGEPELAWWKTDGDRFRSYRDFGGSLIVRSLYIKNLIEKANPDFYNPADVLSGSLEERLQ